MSESISSSTMMRSCFLSKVRSAIDVQSFRFQSFYHALISRWMIDTQSVMTLKVRFIEISIRNHLRTFESKSVNSRMIKKVYLTFRCASSTTARLNSI